MMEDFNFPIKQKRKYVERSSTVPLSTIPFQHAHLIYSMSLEYI